jgi:hypothetical protein
VAISEDNKIDQNFPLFDSSIPTEPVNLQLDAFNSMSRTEQHPGLNRSLG